MKQFTFKIMGHDVVFEVSPNSLNVTWPMNNLALPAKDIVKIEHELLNDLYEGFMMYLNIHYKSDEKIKRKKYLLFLGQEGFFDFIKELRECFPHADFLGPNEQEKKLLINRKNIYRLEYSVKLAVQIVILSVAGIMVLMGLAGIDGEKVLPLEFTISFSVFVLYSLLWIILLIFKKIYFIRTDDKYMYIRKLLLFREVKWENVKVSAEKTRIKTWKNRKYNTKAVHAYNMVTITDNSTGKKSKLKIPVKSFSKLLRELYYRNVVDYETARNYLAFF